MFKGLFVTATRLQLCVLLGFLSGLLITALVYAAGLDGGFMLDDGPNILQAYIADPDRYAVLYTMTHNGSGVLGRSMSMLSFVLSGLQYGLEPWGYKYHNVLLHLLTGVLLLCLLLQLLPRLAPGLSQERRVVVATLVALLWLLHPLQVSTVLYIVQRMTQLAALFIVLALLAWLKARQEGIARWQYLLFGWCLFPLCTLLAALSKETGALVPVYVLLIELLVFRTRPATLRAQPRLGLLLSVFVLLPLLAAALVLLLRFDAFTDYSTRTFTLGERLLTQVGVLFFYLRLIFLPRLRDMSLFHDDYPVTASLDLPTALLLGLLLLAVASCWLLRRRAPVAAFGIGWFLVSHLMESTIIPLELVFEHRNYLALAGLLLIPVEFACRRVQLAPGMAGCGVVLVLFALMTATRATEWGNREVFHSMSVIEHPRSPRALNNQINTLIGRGDYDQVVALLQRQIEISPLEAGAHMHLQLVQCEEEARDPVIWGTVERLLRERPVSVYTLNGLQALVALVIDGRCKALQVADMISAVDIALAQEDNQAHAENHASLLRLRALLAFSQAYYAQGYAWMMMSHELSPTSSILAELMRYQIAARRFGDAEETLQLLEQQNVRRFGIEEYQVRAARQMLERGRLEAAALAPAPAEEPAEVQSFDQ